MLGDAVRKGCRYRRNLGAANDEATLHGVIKGGGVLSRFKAEDERIVFRRRILRRDEQGSAKESEKQDEKSRSRFHGCPHPQGA
jgi:hypothetical protein